ncbi:MAG: hypothetical protein R6W31_04855, partial [Bacteroidales bacterium]
MSLTAEHQRLLIEIARDEILHRVLPEGKHILTKRVIPGVLREKCGAFVSIPEGTFFIRLILFFSHLGLDLIVRDYHLGAGDPLTPGPLLTWAWSGQQPADEAPGHLAGVGGHRGLLRGIDRGHRSQHRGNSR